MVVVVIVVLQPRSVTSSKAFERPPLSLIQDGHGALVASS